MGGVSHALNIGPDKHDDDDGGGDGGGGDDDDHG